MDNLLKYIAVKKENRTKQLPLLKPGVGDSDAVYSMYADLGLRSAYEKYGEVGAKVYIQGAPKTRVMTAVAMKQAQKDVLRLVPWSSNVGKVALQPKDDCYLYLTVETDPPKRFEIKPPSKLGKEVEIEYWRVQEERKDAKYANLMWSTVEESIPCPASLGVGKSLNVVVPILVLSKDVGESIELRVFRRPKETTKRMAVSLSGIGPPKKTSKSSRDV